MGESLFGRWLKKFSSDPGQAFLVKASSSRSSRRSNGCGERPSSSNPSATFRKSLRLPREGRETEFAFVTKHQGVWHDVLDRQVEVTTPNQKWIADVTYLWTAEGWLYAPAVIDLFSPVSSVGR